MDVKLCMKCFSKKVKKHLHHDETDVYYFPLVMDWICEDCGYKGIPIVFYSEEDYAKFVSVLEPHKSDRYKED
jgi:C4-type Zn-finger protein